MLKEFYQVTGQLCFTLLGFWWLIVRFRHTEFAQDANRRFLGYHVSLSFLLPGLMSIVSLLSEGATSLWRLGFGLAGALGVAEAFVAAVHARTRLWRLALWAMFAVYAVMTFVALFPAIVRAAGVGLRPIEVEAVLVSLFLFLSVNFAWMFMMEPLAEVPGEE